MTGRPRSGSRSTARRSVSSGITPGRRRGSRRRAAGPTASGGASALRGSRPTRSGAPCTRLEPPVTGPWPRPSSSAFAAWRCRSRPSERAGLPCHAILGRGDRAGPGQRGRAGVEARNHPGSGMLGAGTDRGRWRLQRPRRPARALGGCAARRLGGSGSRGGRRPDTRAGALRRHRRARPVDHRRPGFPARDLAG